MTNPFEKLVGDDRMLALIGTNFSAAAIAGFFHKVTPYMDAILVLMQVIIAAYTLLHIVKKSLKSHDAKNTKRLGHNRDARRARRVRNADSEEG
jgi:hypothetical protein